MERASGQNWGGHVGMEQEGTDAVIKGTEDALGAAILLGSVWAS